MLVEATTNYSWHIPLIVLVPMFTFGFFIAMSMARLNDFRENFISDPDRAGKSMSREEAQRYDKSFADVAGVLPVKYSDKQMKRFSIATVIVGVLLFASAFFSILFSQGWEHVSVKEQLNNYYGVELSDDNFPVTFSQGVSVYIDNLPIADSNDVINNAVVTRGAAEDKDVYTLFSLDDNGELVEAEQVNPMIVITPLNMIVLLPALIFCILGMLSSVSAYLTARIYHSYLRMRSVTHKKHSIA